MDLRDIALQSTMPAVMVPFFGEFEPLAAPGNRILNARDGIWIEARRPGIYSRQPIALQNIVAMPYGIVAPALETGFSHLGETVREFVEFARQAFPNEVAMALIWDEATGKLVSQILEPVSNSPGHITYKRPDLTEGQHVVVDIHSHGNFGAFFSRTDNEDDRGDLKIAIVVGNVDQPNPTVKARLCTLGHYLPLSISITGSDRRKHEGEANVSPPSSW